MAAFLSSKTFKIQNFESSDISESTSCFRASRRIYLNAGLLKSAKILSGEPLLVTACKENEAVENPPFAIGLAWPEAELPSGAAILSQSNILSANLLNDNQARILPLSDAKATRYLEAARNPRVASSVILVETTESLPNNKKDEKGHRWRALYAKEILISLKFVYYGQRIQVNYEGKHLMFTVNGVSSSAGEASGLDVALASLSIKAKPTLYSTNWETKVSITVSPVKSHEAAQNPLATSSTHNGYSSVGGLEKQIAQIRDLVDIPLTRPDLFRHFGLRPPKGILLYGPPGTGKTHLARAIVSATRASVITINGSELSSAYHGETEERLRNVFNDARQRSPCIVVLDEVDALCPRREDGGGSEVEKRVVATLLTIMDGIQEQKNSSAEEEEEDRVVVIATTNRPNAIDPALRRPGRFDREIEVGIPDARARFSILKVLLAKTPHGISDDDLRSIASRTHGYVGADLGAVVREAGTIAIKRFLELSQAQAAASHASVAPSIHPEDLASCLSIVQPSAMREVYVEVPTVRWSDIGGQAHTQQKLRECVEWPLKHPNAFVRLGVKPPKGILLFGPPGCSKTLTARALATESGLNFIAVKGPELLNKFVGESERAVREIFRKARAASPSIVFFDEIDALGTSRSGDGSAGSKHEGVLTTLLNEMDGVQELVGVTIVAATNRPDVIDSALMRPGRLDRILYVGPPDHQGRVDILRIRMKGMAIADDVDIEELARLTDGCSGAEITALCQDAALLTMQADINSPNVPRSAFLSAAKAVRRQITQDVISYFQHWKETSGLAVA